MRNPRRRKPEPPEPAPQDYQAREKIKTEARPATTRDPMKNSADRDAPTAIGKGDDDGERLVSTREG